MMQKRSLVSLMLISFMVVLSSSLAFANEITIQSTNTLRCDEGTVDVTANVSADAVSAIEVVLEINGSGCGFLDRVRVDWDAGFTALPDRFVDTTTGVDGIAPDTIRFAALRLDDSDPLPSGAHVIAQISYTTNDCCEGGVTFDAGTWLVPSPPGPGIEVTTQFVNADDASLLPAAVNAGTISIVNSAPSIASIGNQTIPWGDVFSISAGASDDDEANGCELLSYTKVSGPDSLKVNPGTGFISWQTLGADVCTHTVSVAVLDKCGAADTTTFEICVTNEPPTLACPDFGQIVAGDVATAPAVGDDPDGGPLALLYSLVSTDFPGSLTVHPATGMVTITTDVDPAQTGTFSATVSVTDGANTCDPCSPSNSAECTFEFAVVHNSVRIACVQDVIRSKPVDVEITMQGPEWNSTPIAGYDLLIAYDRSALTFLSVAPGQFLEDCGWEYFTYRQGYNGNCGNACPTGVLRLVALAEQNDGQQTATCYSNDQASSQLAVITFLVGSDNNLECQQVPVRFWWVDCGDNTLSSVTGDTLLIAHDVYENLGGGYVLLDPATEFPTYNGAPPECDVSDKGYPWRAVDYYNGCVKIICNDEIDARGDINVNGIAYEIADAVMYTNYFLQGLSAFLDHVDASVAASDANADGLELSVADLVYLLRVVVGDAQPFPKLDSYDGNYTWSDAGVISVKSSLGAAYFEFAGEVTPELRNDDAIMNYSFVDGNTRVLVTIPMDRVTSGFTGEVIEVNGEMLDFEVAAFDGAPIEMVHIPDHFELSQNYPNPFNPTTTISFALPNGGDWTLTVYNIMGQVVETFEGSAGGAEFIDVEWNASNVASGVYFYRLTADNNTQVKKAVLLK